MNLTMVVASWSLAEAKSRSDWPEGEAKGKAEGLAEGKAAGLAEGLAEG